MEIDIQKIANWQSIEHKWAKLKSSVGMDYLSPSIRQKFHIDFIFISSNLEGIDITREEVESIVTMYPSLSNVDKSRNSIKQAIGQKRALELLDSIVRTHKIPSQEQFYKKFALRDIP